MKIKSLKLPFARKSILLVCFFSVMFIFASFTKEDRYKIREWKKALMSRLTDEKDLAPEKSNLYLNEFLSSNIYSRDQLINISSESLNNNESGDPHLTVEIANSKNFEERTVDVLNSYSAREKEGTIGVYSDKEEDVISDNFFTIDIPVQNKELSEAFLEYDLFGLSSHQSVPRSINGNLAIGGEIIIPQPVWSHQKEHLGSEIIKSGTNTILFTAPSEGIKYKIRNLKIVFEKNRVSSKNLIVNSILSDNQLYVKGINVMSDDLTINGRHVSSKNGEFEKIISLSENDKENGSFTVTNKSVSQSYKIPNTTESFKIFNNNYFNSRSIRISNNEELDIEYEDLKLKVERETSEAAYIEVLKLREKDFPSTSNGLKNVTMNKSGYRYSKVSGLLNKKVKITIPYDENRLGSISPNEIKVFLFDYSRRQWIISGKSIVDQKNKTVTFEGDADGDYINGIISTPESPQINASNPTGISDLKAINPAVGRNIISAPTANQKGSANIAYPILMPAGRKGMQPNIKIAYDSNKSNGWMGEGWDVSGLSSIDIDTRWGSPRFDPTDETELYSIDGTMLVYDNNYLPHRHNDISEFSSVFTTDKQKRTDYLTNNKKTFFLRKNHNFSKIERYGLTPADYRWIVTTPAGVKIFYGGDENQINAQSVVKDAAGNITSWGVWKERDVNGNFIEYEYDNFILTGQSGGNSNLNGGNYFHIKKITYTKRSGRSASFLKYYTVEFEKESSILRQDISINAKKGVKEIEPYRLDKINVKYDNILIRSYKFSYKEGEYSKTLLKGIVHTDNSNDPSYNNVTTDEYIFDYHNDIKDPQTNAYKHFSSDSNVNANIANAFPVLPNSLSPSKIQANSTFEWGVNGRVGVGLNFLFPTQDPYGHAMVSGMLGYSQAEAKNAQQLIDFNGDGIQDIIYRQPNSGLFVSAGSLSSGSLNFGSPKQLLNLNSNFSYTKTKTDNKGYDFGLKVFGLGYNRSFVWSNTRSTTSTYLTDANSDGLIDVVKDGQVWFNRINSGGANEMTNFSDTTENMVIVADDALQSNDNESGVDVVKFWIAPKDGAIRFTDNISIENKPNAKAVYSVEVLNPSSATTPTNGRLYLKILTPSLPVQNISITRYDDYFSQIQAITPVESNNHFAINNHGFINVKSGDKIFVRLHKNNVKDFKVYSNPKIDYVWNYIGGGADPVPNTVTLEQDGFFLNNGSYSDNYFLNNGLNDLTFDSPGTVTINIPAITFPKSNDKISFKVVKLDVNSGNETILYPPSSTPPFPQSDIPFPTPSFTINETINSGQPIKIRFKVESDTHRSFKEANWNDIAVNYQTTIGANSNPINVKGIPEYPSHFITDFTEKINLSSHFNSSANTQYLINFNKNLPVGGLKGNFVYIIKKGNNILAKRRVEVGTLNSPYVVEYDLINNQTLSNFAPVLVHHGSLQNGVQVHELITIQIYCNTLTEENFYKLYRGHFQGKPFYFTQNDATVISGTVAATSINSRSLNPYSFIYNNYGQFLYDQSSDMIFDKRSDTYIPNPNTPSDYFGKVINPSLVQGMNSPPIGNLAGCVNLPTQAEVEQCIQQNSGPYNSSNVGAPPAIFPLYPFKNNNNVEKWMGKGLPEQYSMADSFKDDDSVSSLFSTAGIDPEIIDMPVQGNVDTKMHGIDKRYYSRAKTKTVSGSLIVVNLSNSESHLEGDKNIMTQDFIDLNGDGYPDIVYKDSSQITNATGGLGKGAGANPNNHDPYLNNYLSKSDNYQNSNAAGFSISGFKTAGRTLFGGESSSTTEADPSTPWADPGANITVFKDPSRDEGMEYWMDINGDGLQDRFNGSGSYSLNMGYRMNGGESFTGLSSYASKPVGAAGIGIDMNVISGGMDYASGLSMGFGVSANIGVSASMGTAERLYEDINSDGLVDILYVEGNSTKVSYNLGNRFAPATPLFKNSSGNVDFNNEAKTYNGGFSLNANAYINIPICCFFFPLLYLKIGAQASGNVGISISEVDKSFKDMNGDGFPDLVVSQNGGFKVNHSTIGRTNKLKKVTNFFSKSPVNIFDIDYEFTKPTYNDPNGRLVMKETRVLNPDAFSNTYLVSTPNKDAVTTYEYKNSHYDRRERDFFGFEEVITKVLEGNAVFRSTKNTYFNKGYFLNGNVRKTETFTGSTALISLTENLYTLYKFKDNNTKINLNTVLPETFDTGGKEGRKMAIALLEQTKTRVFDNGGSVETTINTTYNDKGQLKKYQYTSPTSNYNSVIKYHDLSLPNNILNVPQSIKVFAGTSSSNPLRERETIADPTTGLITQVSVKLNNSQSANTTLNYDTFGNISTVRYPENENGESYSIDYTYDSETYKYVTETTDVFGYTSRSTYDPKFDVVTSATDIGGNITEYEYDFKGRPTKILAPKEREAGAPYTVQYKYYLREGHHNSYYTITNNHFGSLTQHYNALDPSNPIETVSIADGWGRVIQTKKDIFYNNEEKMSVSGRNVVDIHGRSIMQYHPTFEAKDPPSTYGNIILTLSPLSNYYASTVYDARDRVISSTDQLFHTTNNNYSIDGSLLKSTVISWQNNINQLKSETFTSVEGKIVKSRNYLGSQGLETTYNYNDIGELQSVLDPEGIQTLYSYDLAGRRISQIHPDRGVSTSEYDAAGNLIRIYTANLQNGASQNYVQYKYDFNRISEIRLPDLPNGGNPGNVRYFYEQAGVGNNSGKLIRKIDNSGETQYEYGNMGEVVNEFKKVIVYNMPPLFFNTRFTYDSWNRLTNLVYPDGEDVIYEYNLAGNLKRMSNADGYEYIKDIEYDEYEQRTLVVNGNDTRSEFQYNPANRKLNVHVLSDVSGNELLRNNYSYDFVGNVTQLENVAAPFQSMGGNYGFVYEYDRLNRLINANGYFNGSSGSFAIDQSDFTLDVSYNNTGGIMNKSQHHNQNLNQNTQNSYANSYTYNSGTHKVQNIINTNTGDQESFDYDGNGNVVTYDKNGDVDRMYWDEQDRLKVVNKDYAGIYQYNVYNDVGERIIKYNLQGGSQLYQNGALVDAGNIAIEGYKVYPNSYVTIDANKILTKHYYGGPTRIASRIGNFDFTTMKKTDFSKLSDKKEEPDTEADFKMYLKKAGIDIESLTVELSKKGGSDPNVYYLHGDHLGTANFVTERHGDATQFFVNLPFGETMAEQMTGVYDNPFKFNAKELDSDTGLYYYGARYYNPRLSIWYGVDPMAEQTPNWSPFVYTFNNPVRYVDPSGMIPEDPDPPGASIRIPRNGCGCFESKTPGFSLRVGDTGGPWGQNGSTTVWGIIGGKTYYNSSTSTPGVIPKLDEPNAFIQMQIRVGGERSNSQVGLTWFKEKFHGNENDGFGFEAPTAVHASFSKNNLNEIKSGQLSITTNFSLAGGVELGVPRTKLSEIGLEDFGKGYRVIGFGGSAIYRVDVTYRQVSVFVAATGHIMRTNSVTSNITTYGSEVIGSIGIRAGVGINISRK